ncbi:MAG: preprotein translocase subunit SecA [Anaerolineae bacterium]|nr:preprotein translocase subunit SecA [Anaerolineae bacterium]MDW8101369.1 preprotein translocase subunit SecA [Anaerolineae bacterium]
MLKKLLSTVLGESNERELKKLEPLVQEINSLEPEMERLSDEELRKLTEEFRKELRKETASLRERVEEKKAELEAEEEPDLREKLEEEYNRLDEELRKAEEKFLNRILPKAFAAVREASKRTIGLRHFDVQLMGGIVLHQGKVAEMKTGEGKTLVATLPVYLNALTGRGVHVVTVNDYLAKRDTQWMGPIYHLLGLKVGVIQSLAADPAMSSFIYDPDYLSEDDRYQHLRPVSRREAYLADVTYGTNHEFGFDYLRDNMVQDLSECVQRGLNYAIVDEIDNILIDEARTPLIISGPAQESAELYKTFAHLVPQLTPGIDYQVDEKARIATLTEEGIEKVERMLGIENLYSSQYFHLLPYLDNALRAYALYHRDKDYIVKDNEVIIVDEFTGRLMYGRRYSEGLHQAIEAKEGVPIQRESLTLATITFQNYFRLYKKLAGMTGTAATEAEEFYKIYGLDVVVIPTHKPMIRIDYPDVVYKTEEAKFRAVTKEILQLHCQDRPILVGTLSIEKSEHLSSRLSPQRLQDLARVIILRDALNSRNDIDSSQREKWNKALNVPLEKLDPREINSMARKLGVNPNILAHENILRLAQVLGVENVQKLEKILREGIPHQVLNAKYHEKEAQIIAQAGRPGAVTIATNMAGRGVDILLGGNPEGLTREKLRQEGFDLTQIRSSEWDEALKMLRRGEDPSVRFPTRWAQVLAEMYKKCQEDHQKVVKLGGLHVIGTERHEARRIDNQLRGRAGRQGDPGSSRFYVSLEDELMRKMGGAQGLLEKVWADEDMPIEHGLVTKAIEQAQIRMEGYNFDYRKHVLEYDDVVNKQREVIYRQRREILRQKNLRPFVMDILKEKLSALVDSYAASGEDGRPDWKSLHSAVKAVIPPEFLPSPDSWRGKSSRQIEEELHVLAEKAYDTLSSAMAREFWDTMAEQGKRLMDLSLEPNPIFRLVYDFISSELKEELESIKGKPFSALGRTLRERLEKPIAKALALGRDRFVMLRAVDSLWVRHLTDLDELKEGIGLRAFGHQNPLIAFKREAHEMYENLLAQIRDQIAQGVLYTFVAVKKPEPAMPRLRVPVPAQVPQGQRRPGRNEPCWCGSGKKYKHCHMRQDEAMGRR